jgi:branched-chain amino acid transport system ATP-binding protein
MLDEPSEGLAPTLVLQVFELLNNLKDQGFTILLVEQHIYHALEFADRAYILETGRITLQGTGKEILDNPHVKKAYLGM